MIRDMQGNFAMFLRDIATQLKCWSYPLLWRANCPQILEADLLASRLCQRYLTATLEEQKEMLREAGYAMNRPVKR